MAHEALRLKSLLRHFDRYAAVHSQDHGEPVDSLVLIPHMLDAFMKRDRGTRALSSKRVSS
jgi:hypothetical protein